MKEIFKYGKCIFTRPNMANLDDMVEMMNDEEIVSMISLNPKPISREMEIEWINNNQEGYVFSAYDINSLKYIGNCSFVDIVGNKGEIGIVICKPMQGNHYAKDMLNGVMDYGFNTLGLDEIYAIVFSDNVKSLNCIKQLGFVEYKREAIDLHRNGIDVEDVYLKKMK